MSTPSHRPTKRHIFLYSTLFLGVAACAFVFANHYIGQPDKELYLIPADFKGPMCVVYGEKCGIVPAVENGRDVMLIPANGILIVQLKPKFGTVDNEYYLVDKAGKRKRIQDLNATDTTGKTQGVYLTATGSLGGGMPDGSSSSESRTAVHYTSFIVYNNNKDTLRELDMYKKSEQFDSLTAALVNDCRREVK